jgi:hypothetical protein
MNTKLSLHETKMEVGHKLSYIWHAGREMVACQTDEVNPENKTAPYFLTQGIGRSFIWSVLLKNVNTCTQNVHVPCIFDIVPNEVSVPHFSSLQGGQALRTGPLNFVREERDCAPVRCVSCELPSVSSLGVTLLHIKQRYFHFCRVIYPMLTSCGRNEH